MRMGSQEVEPLRLPLLLFDATGAVVRPGAIGSILHLLNRPNVLDELELWPWRALQLMLFIRSQRFLRCLVNKS